MREWVIVTDKIINQARRGFRWVLLSQLLTLLLGSLKAFLIPGFLGIEDFAYWQIYVFYVAYVGLFTLGFNDGIYLRFGGKEYAALPLPEVRASLRWYGVLLGVLTALLLGACLQEGDPRKRMVLVFVVLNISIMGMQAVFSFALQATGRLQRYSLLNMVDKTLFIFCLLAAFAIGRQSFIYFVAVEFAAKVVALGMMFISCRELVIGASAGWKSGWLEFMKNVNAGSKLMFANLSGMFVLGAGRIVIEYFGNLESYAFYAFGVSMTNLVLVATTALSIVIYPTLKRLPVGSYGQYYNKSNRSLFLFNVLMLGAYFPIVGAMYVWLPAYLPAVPYLNMLFVVAALQSKMQLLNNSYYKVLRLEAAMLRANLASLAIVIILSFSFYAVAGTVMSIAVAAVLTMAYRVFSSERFLRRAMGTAVAGMQGIEIVMLATFVFLTTVLPIGQAGCFFAAAVLLYGMYAKNDVRMLAQLLARSNS